MTAAAIVRHSTWRDSIERQTVLGGQDIEQGWRQQFGFGFDCLTRSEARYLEQTANAQTIRDRVIAAGLEEATDQDLHPMTLAETIFSEVRTLSEAHAPVSQKQVVRGGMKTVYRITPSGKRRFQQLLHEQLAEFTRSIDPATLPG